jgi:hypothetical protein
MYKPSRFVLLLLSCLCLSPACDVKDIERAPDVTPRACDGAGRIVWVHANPPSEYGGGGFEFYRTFAIDLSGCEGGGDVSLQLSPTNDPEWIVELGPRKPGCLIFGAPMAKVPENVPAIGTSTAWATVAMALFMDGELLDTVTMPTDDLQAAFTDQPLALVGNEWQVLPVDHQPGCYND